MTIILFTIGAMSLFFIGLSINLIVKRKGEFKGTCASQSKFLNNEDKSCGLCGRTVQSGDTCDEKNKK